MNRAMEEKFEQMIASKLKKIQKDQKIVGEVSSVLKKIIEVCKCMFMQNVFDWLGCSIIYWG